MSRVPGLTGRVRHWLWPRLNAPAVMMVTHGRDVLPLFAPHTMNNHVELSIRLDYQTSSHLDFRGDRAACL